MTRLKKASPTIYLAALFFLFLFGGCGILTNSSRQLPEASGFSITQIEQSSAAGPADSADPSWYNWAIPSQVRYQIALRLMNPDKTHPLNNQKFTVDDNQGWTTGDISTDSEGWLRFSLSFPVEYFGPPQLLQIKFYVEAVELERGRAELPLEFNPNAVARKLDARGAAYDPNLPWSSGLSQEGLSQADLNQMGRNPTTGLKQVKSFSPATTALRWSEFEAKLDRAGRQIRFGGNLDYFVSAPGMNPQTIPVEKGLVFVNARLLDRTGKIIANSEARTSQERGQVENRSLHALLNLSQPWPNKMHSGETYFLSVQIKPDYGSGAPRSLGILEQMASLKLNRNDVWELKALEPIQAPSRVNQALARGNIRPGMEIVMAPIAETGVITNPPSQSTVVQALPGPPGSGAPNSSGPASDQSVPVTTSPGFNFEMIKLVQVLESAANPNLATVRFALSTCVGDTGNALASAPYGKKFRIRAHKPRVLQANTGRLLEARQIPREEKPFEIVKAEMDELTTPGSIPRTPPESEILRENTSDNPDDGVRMKEFDEIRSIQNSSCGLFVFDDEIEYRPYHREVLIVRKYDFVDPETGHIFTRSVQFNPWKINQYLRDVTDLPPVQTRLIRQPKLYIRNYTTSSLEMIYRVNDNLNLELHKAYQLSLEARVDRDSYQPRDQYGASQTDLVEGYYLLRVGLMRPNTELPNLEKTYIAGNQQIIYVPGNGRFSAIVEFEFWQIAIMNERVKIMFSLLPIDQTKVAPNFNLHNDRFPSESRVDQSTLVAASDDPESYGLIDSSSGLQTPVYSGRFIPNLERDARLTTEDEPAIDTTVLDFIQSYDRPKLTDRQLFEEKMSLQKFDELYRYHYVNLSHPTPRDLELLTEAGNPVDTALKLSYLINNWEMPTLISNLHYVRICQLWGQRFIKNIAHLIPHEKDEIFLPISIEKLGEILTRRCEVSFLNHESADFGRLLNVDRVAYVRKVDTSTSNYVEGFSFNYNLSAGFKLSQSHKWSAGVDNSTNFSANAQTSIGTSLNLRNLLESWIRRQFGFNAGSSARSGSASNISKQIFGFDSRPLNIYFGRTRQYGQKLDEALDGQQSADLSFGSNTYLVFQLARVSFNIRDFDRCLLIKPAWNLINMAFDEIEHELARQPGGSVSKGFHKKVPISLTTRFSEQTRLIYGDSGLRICEHIPNDTLYSMVENYYSVGQHFNPGNLLDPYTARTQPWMIEFRGHRDFLMLLNLIYRKEDYGKVGSRRYTPLEGLLGAYRIFRLWREGNRELDVPDVTSQAPAWPHLYVLKNQGEIAEERGIPTSCRNESPYSLQLRYLSILQQCTQIRQVPFFRNFLFPGEKEREKELRRILIENGVVDENKIRETIQQSTLDLFYIKSTDKDCKKRFEDGELYTDMCRPRF